jgi:pimeloyl-ACP methyl ester carboxylesterase
MVAAPVKAHTLAGCGHFMTEERPEFVVEQILAMAAKTHA